MSKLAIDLITSLASIGLCFFAAYTCFQVRSQIKQTNSLKCLEKITEFFDSATKVLNDIPHDYDKWEIAQILIQSATSLKSKLSKKHAELYKSQIDIFRINLKNILNKIPTSGFFFFIPNANKLDFDQAEAKFQEMTKNNAWSGELQSRLPIIEYNKLSSKQIELFLQIVAPCWNYNKDETSKLEGYNLYEFLTPFFPEATLYYKRISKNFK